MALNKALPLPAIQHAGDPCTPWAAQGRECWIKTKGFSSSSVANEPCDLGKVISQLIKAEWRIGLKQKSYESFQFLM